MPQLYLFIFAALAIAFIITRRNIIFQREKKIAFKKSIAKKVDNLRKAARKDKQDRFKESHFKERGQHKFNLAKYKEGVRKAEMAIAKQNWKEAKRILIQALSLAKDELPVSLKLAKAYMHSGDRQKALTLYRRLVEINPENPDIYENMAKIYIKQKRYKDAIQAYVRAVELDEKDDQKLIGLGKLYELLMRHSVAAECFRRAAELKPRDVNCLFLLANACKEDEDFDNALYTYERILTLEPYNEKAKDEAQEVRVRMKAYEFSTS